jgi:hypothetical protein
MQSTIAITGGDIDAMSILRGASSRAECAGNGALLDLDLYSPFLYYVT